MRTRILSLGVALVLPSLLIGCGGPEETGVSETPETPEAASPDASSVLELYANGEERPQVGFTSVDGWELTFDHIYVNFTEIQAHQTDPPYDYTSLSPIEDAIVTVEFAPQTVDLVTGNEDDPTVFVASAADAAPGHYNAISWKMAPIADGPAAGYTMAIVGSASRDGETIAFVLNVEQEFAYYCGDFVGDERKGILEEGATAEVEATFHFDHLFGEGSKDPQDPLNLAAFGFDPLAALAVDGQVEVDTTTLADALPPEDFARFENTIVELGHAGEGHCYEHVSGRTS